MTQTLKVVRSKDVMDALLKVFDSLKGQKLPTSEVAHDVYRGLLPVPEFYASELTPALNTPERDAETPTIE